MIVMESGTGESSGNLNSVFITAGVKDIFYKKPGVPAGMESTKPYAGYWRLCIYDKAKTLCGDTFKKGLFTLVR